MKYSVLLPAFLVALALLWTPVGVQGQNKDILALTRDMAAMQRQFDAMQKAQGERSDALEALLKQALEASRALAAEIQTVQQNLQQSFQQSMQKSLAEQQTRVSEPMAALTTGVHNIEEDVVRLGTDMSSVNTKLGKIETMLDEMQRAVRTLNATPVAPPPSPTEGADRLFTAAEHDFLTGNNQLALEEFKAFWEMYPASPNAPRALLHIGKLYDRVLQYPDARGAFDTILERFPDSTTTPEAYFWKAEMLAKEGNSAAAATEFENFGKKYPGDLNAATAAARVRELRNAKGKAKGKG